MDFRDRIVVITGASSGIGRSCAVRFAELGCRLVLTSRSEAGLEATAAQAKAPNATLLAADLADSAQITRLADQVAERFDRVDILINNAGVGLYAPSFRSEPEQVRRLFEVNFLAPFELTRRLLPRIPRGGAIVNVSSIGGKIPLPWQTAYSCSKWALNGFSDALRMELAGSGIHVLSVCPGTVTTPFSEHALGGRLPESIRRRRLYKISPERCAHEIVRGLRRRARTIVIPRAGWLVVAAARLVPSLVYGRMARLVAEARYAGQQ